MSNFCQTYDFENLINDHACYENPACIDLIMTNKPKCIQNSVIIETGLSNFDKMTRTVLKTYFKGQNPNVIVY